MKKIIPIICVLHVFLTIGCGKIFNPYKSEYMCPDVYKGKCATMDEAYQESFGQNEMVISGKKGCGDCQKNQPEIPAYNYKNSSYRDRSAVIDDPEAPKLIPARVARVLITNYTEENDATYYGYRHIYFIVDQPRFNGIR